MDAPILSVPYGKDMVAAQVGAISANSGEAIIAEAMVADKPSDDGVFWARKKVRLHSGRDAGCIHGLMRNE